MTKRRNRRLNPNDPAALAARLPTELRSFDGWYYPQGLQDYMAALSRFVAGAPTAYACDERSGPIRR